MDHPETILIVDDDEALRMVLRDFLQDMGYLVIEAAEGEGALELCEARRPDMVLLDVVMPGLSGLDVCRQIKARPGLAEIPVIFISSLREASEKVSSFLAGGVDYVDKPFRFEEVRARVRTHLELARQRRRLVEANAKLQAAVEGSEALNRELIGLNETLRHAEELKGRFIAKMKHVLNNPLGAISALAGQIAAGGLPEGSIRDLATHIQAESFSLDFHLRNLFYAGELEAGECLPEASSVDVPAILRDVVDTWSQAAAGKALAIDAQASGPGLETFTTDAPKLHHILSNLLVNAIVLSPPGGRVVALVRTGPEGLLLQVSNMGQGLNEAQRAQVFQRFSELGSSSQGTLGDGLGMAVVQALADLLGGQVALDSEVGAGATFSVSLPRLLLDPEAGASPDGNLLFFQDPEAL
jgi:signal transduction histidine kinase